MKSLRLKHFCKESCCELNKVATIILCQKVRSTNFCSSVLIKPYVTGTSDKLNGTAKSFMFEARPVACSYLVIHNIIMLDYNASYNIILFVLQLLLCD